MDYRGLMVTGWRRVSVVGAFLASVALLGAADDRPPQLSTLMGGTGGAPTAIACGSGRVLVGVSGRARSWLDNLYLRCATVDGAALSNVQTVPTRIGGLGGKHTYSLQCPSGQVVKGVMVYQGIYINRIGLYCRGWNGTEWTNNGNLIGPAGGSGGSYDRRDCSFRFQPVRGLHSRGGNYVDALGILCDEP